ncbi:MAG: hypothetical protein JW810_09800 [Sedimentisphaerales bacterium]|nr:hypothetical protein [Sedimentisphaerales bacterium]
MKPHRATVVLLMLLGILSDVENGHGEPAKEVANSAVDAVVVAAADANTVRAEPPGRHFAWVTAGPVLAPLTRDGFEWYAVKDPSAVVYQGSWHLFCTVRGRQRSHAIEYLSFRDWNEAARAPRRILPLHPGYFCAPQVFYFGPQRRWYLIFQASDERWQPEYQPACSTTTDITDADSWSPPTPLFERKPDNIRNWLDFWVICTDRQAYLFFTSLDGRMWRSRTPLGDFPHGWSAPTVALQGDVFEASHTYKLKGRSQYLTLIEAQNGAGWRYYKAYAADDLDGPWRELAASRVNAFASMNNVQQTAARWTDSISHGELLRSGHDELLEVDPANLRFLFQGVLDADRAGKPYGQIPWRLGILESRQSPLP